jgi:hypothetical protein
MTTATMRLTLFELAVVVILGSGMLCADETPQLHLVRPLTTSTTVHVMLENSQIPCQTFFVDRLFLPRKVSGRPETVLRFTIFDSTGNPVLPAPRLSGTFKAARPADLISVDCGMVIGRVVDISSDMWFGGLPPGVYRVRATLRIGSGRFGQSNPAFVKALSRITHTSQAAIRLALKDFELTSNEIEIRVW